MALKSKSLACLKYLVERYGLRKSMRNIDLIFKHDIYGEFAFKNIMFPVLLKLKDTDALAYLSNKRKDFVISTQDLNSFVSLALQEKWVIGLKTFLLSDSG